MLRIESLRRKTIALLLAGGLLGSIAGVVIRGEQKPNELIGIWVTSPRETEFGVPLFFQFNFEDAETVVVTTFVDMASDSLSDGEVGRYPVFDNTISIYRLVKGNHVVVEGVFGDQKLKYLFDEGRLVFENLEGDVLFTFRRVNEAVKELSRGQILTP